MSSFSRVNKALLLFSFSAAISVCNDLVEESGDCWDEPVAAVAGGKNSGEPGDWLNSSAAASASYGSCEYSELSDLFIFVAVEAGGKNSGEPGDWLNSSAATSASCGSCEYSEELSDLFVFFAAKAYDSSTAAPPASYEMGDEYPLSTPLLGFDLFSFLAVDAITTTLM